MAKNDIFLTFIASNRQIIDIVVFSVKMQKIDVFINFHSWGRHE